MTAIHHRDSTTHRASLRALQVAALALAFTLSACASKPPVSQPGAEPPAAPPAVSHAASESPTEVATVIPQRQDSLANLSAEELAARAALEREGMVIYFDYDSAQIKAEFLPLLAAHARFASRFRATSIRLEGHTDERGSREYNIALGERRARAVRNALELQGVPGTQLTTVSYGEERPAATGTGESIWSQNRRVEISHAR